MKQEKLFLALADIGDDLIELAETRRFSNNGWKKWASLAASVVLVLCLGALVLPELPIGCGAGMAAPESAEGSVWEGYADNMKTEINDGIIEDSVEEAIPEEAPDAEAPPADNGQQILVIGGQRYEPVEWPELELSEEDLGEPFDTVTQAYDESLIGCSAYRYEDDLIVVISSDRWILCKLLAAENETSNG